jgi:murein DD-endopeptidase MepM/ murein hydrolase activator NlpD
VTSPAGDTFGADAQTLRLAGRSVSADLREALADATMNRTVEGASTLELTVHDSDRTLTRSPLFGERTVASVDKAVFELVQVRKTSSFLSVVFEDAVVADLRRKTGKGAPSAKAGTTTIDVFARRLVSAAPGAKFVGYAGQRNLDQLTVGDSTGEDGTEDYWSALQRFAQERGWRCLADRGTVYLGPDSWLLARVPALSIREHTAGVEDIDWDADSGKDSVRASFFADMSRWSAAPGTAVNVADQGLGSGQWLVAEVSRPLFRLQGSVTLVRKQPALPEPKPAPRDDGQPTALAVASSGGASVAGPVSARGFSWPVTGTLTSGYGQRGGRLHAGQDIAVPIGTPVRAAKAGTVTFAGTASGYGTAVYLDHGRGQVTRYAHLSRLLVRRGQQVALGEQIALSGNSGNSTGPHLHFEVRVGGSAVNPAPYLPTLR